MLTRLGGVRHASGDWPGAERTLRESVGMYRNVVGSDHQSLAKALDELALVLEQLSKREEAEALYRESLAIRRKGLGNDHPYVAKPSITSQCSTPPKGKLLKRSGCFKKPSSLIARHSANLLGGCLTDEGDYTAAEPLLTESAGIVMKQFGPGTERTQAATTRVVTVYERWGKPAQAAEWRAKLQKEGRGK